LQCVPGCHITTRAPLRNNGRVQSRGRRSFTKVVVAFALLATQVATPQNRPAGQATAKSLLRGSFSLTSLSDRCPEFVQSKVGGNPDGFRECKVSEFGKFGSIGQQTYYYALYCLMPNYEPTQAKCGGDSYPALSRRQNGMAVFVGNTANARVALLFERIGDQWSTLIYDQPQILKVAAGTLLYLPIRVDGTGHFNVSDYFIRDNGTWKPVEAEGWLKDLAKRLPAGLEIWKGVWPQLGSMTAEAGLYRPGDTNCCPTGGYAQISLAIRSGHFVIKSLVVEKPE